MEANLILGFGYSSLIPVIIKFYSPSLSFGWKGALIELCLIKEGSIQTIK